MPDLKVVGLDVDGRHILCEGDDPTQKYRLRVDDRLRAAVRGDLVRLNQTQIDIEVKSVLTPKEIQARIRAGASVEQLAEQTDADITRIERFAHPVLLERSRAAELATAAHPVLSDGPAVLTLLEAVTTSMISRGLNPDVLNWDAWRNEDSRWTVQLAWKAGKSDNLAHFHFTRGAHGGTVTAVDESATELVDPSFERVLRPVARVAQLDFDAVEHPIIVEPAAPAPAPARTPAAEDKRPAPRAKKARPAVPGWEDVLLGVRSSGDR